jgi:hypothetical protein
VVRLERSRKLVVNGDSGSGNAGGAVAVEEKDARVTLSLSNLASVPPRETMNVNLAAADVGAAYRAVLGAVRDGDGAAGGGGGRVMSTQLSGNKPEEMTGSISGEVRSEGLAKVLGVLREQGAVLGQTVQQNGGSGATAAKEGLTVTIVSAATIPPRRTTTLGEEVGDVGKGMERIRAALPAGAKVIEDATGKEANGRETGRITVEVPVADALKVLSAVRDLGGEERVNNVQVNADSPDTKFAKERISVNLTGRGAIVGQDQGVWVTVRAAVASALGALSWSLYLVLTGVLFLLPWAGILWVVRRVWRRRAAA